MYPRGGNTIPDGNSERIPDGATQNGWRRRPNLTRSGGSEGLFLLWEPARIPRGTCGLFLAVLSGRELHLRLPPPPTISVEF